MKKTFLILVLFLIGISFFELNAQYPDCPEGYTLVQFHSTHTFIHPITGLPIECPLLISYCYKIETNGTINLVLEWWTTIGDCYGNFTWWDTPFKEWIREKIIDHFNLNKNLNHIACPNQGNVMILKLSSCWGSVYEPNPLGGGIYRFTWCSNASYCVYEYEVCTDFNVTPALTIMTQISSTQLGIPECNDGPIIIGGNTCILFCD